VCLGLFELLTALLEYLDLLQRGCSPPAFRVIWDLWLWNIQYSGTALLLLVNPFILHRNNRTARPTYVLIVTLRYQLCSTRYAAVQINYCFKRTFVIKVATMKITDYLMKAITCLPLNRHLLWWTKMHEWYTKEGRVKFMKDALYAQQYGKTHLCNIEQRKNQALSHCWVTRVWRHEAGRQAGRQAVSQSVENSVKYFFF